MTEKFQIWWKQHRHTIQFNIDGEAFIIQVSDEKYPTPLEFETRSKGFRWFFSFYLVFTAETDRRHANSILLLDEPGLHLYPPAQEELIEFFDSLSQDNQVIYTTHSGFMIDARNLDRVRFLEELEDGLVRISPDTASVAHKTVIPVQALVYYQAARLLFLARRVFVVEGETDNILLLYASEILKSEGRPGLPRHMTLSFAGGARSVPPLVAMYLSQEFEIAVLLDNDPSGRAAGKKLENAGYLDRKNVALGYYGDILGKSDPFDLETILPEALYLESVEETHEETIPSSVRPTKDQTLSSAVKGYLRTQGKDLDKGKALQWLINKWQSGETIPETMLEDMETLFEWAKETVEEMTSGLQNGEDDTEAGSSEE